MHIAFAINDKLKKFLQQFSLISNNLLFNEEIKSYDLNKLKNLCSKF